MTRAVAEREKRGAATAARMKVLTSETIAKRVAAKQFQRLGRKAEKNEQMGAVH